MEWSVKKEQIIKELHSKGVVCKVFQRKYLAFMRRINTALNLLNVSGYSWEAMIQTKPIAQAHELIADLKQNHFYNWQKVTGAISDDPYYSFPNVGDFLA